MKRVANSVSARTVSAVNYVPTAVTRYLVWVPEIPNYVWLAMMILTISALSVSTLMRSQGQEREARASYMHTKTRVENARSVHQQIREQTEQIKNNPRAAAQVAQDQLRLVRKNEIVVGVP